MRVFSLSLWMMIIITISSSFLFIKPIIGFTTIQTFLLRRPKQPTTIPSSSSTLLFSNTPFDASLYKDLTNDDDNNEYDNGYDNNDLSNPYTSNLTTNKSSSPPPLTVKPNTKLILGLNKYSHDVSICAADIKTGKVLFATSKERYTRIKHDSGNTANLVDLCLNQLNLTLDNIQKVIVNNHHHRVLPMEENYDVVEWEEGMRINGGMEGGYTDEENLLGFLVDGEGDGDGDGEGGKVEMSHHLAHAYSCVVQCPFDNGLIVIMDGMGETYRTMKAAQKTGEGRYISDLAFEGEYECIPSNIQERSSESIYDWREGESIYEFQKDLKNNGISVKPIFKRFIEEKTPPVLYNHGFENMESVGALYSRSSSHIFGDWNACGKVMGLAPWMGHTWKTAKKNNNDEDDDVIEAEELTHSIMKGTLYKDDDLMVDKSSMMRSPFFARNDPDLFDLEGNMIRTKRYDFDDNGAEEEEENEQQKRLPTNAALDAISLASRIQLDLEHVVLDFVRHYKEKTRKDNLCIAGGVALNSVLNGKLSRDLGFKKVFIPPYPGDDGIAVGCCAYGLYGNNAIPKAKNNNDDDSTSTISTISKKEIPPLWTEPLSPYLGPLYTKDQIRDAIEAAAPWLDVELVTSDEERYEIMSREIESGGVIAWFQGRSELGPRALGHRSILADPRKKGLVRFINESVKLRESFRPFAPSVLSEQVGDWFELGNDLEETANFSPFMSMTSMVQEKKRDLIPAVTHVDGSSRLQTVTKEAEPQYHAFISKFFKRTGVPMVLNTSFNTLPGEPIVESPKDAIRTFLSSMGAIEILVMEDYVIKRKSADIRRLLGEKSEKGLLLPPTFPKRAGPAHYESKFTVENSDDEVKTVTKVLMPDRPMHDSRDGKGWFTLLDELEGEILGVCNGKIGVNDILSQYMQSADIGGDGSTSSKEEEIELQEMLFGNLMRRLIRLYEYTLISW